MQSGRRRADRKAAISNIGCVLKPRYTYRLASDSRLGMPRYSGKPAWRGERRIPLCAASIMKYLVICTMSVRQ